MVFYKKNIYNILCLKKTYQFLNLKIYPNKSLTLITLVIFFLIFFIITTLCSSIYFIIIRGMACFNFFIS